MTWPAGKAKRVRAMVLLWHEHVVKGHYTPPGFNDPAQQPEQMPGLLVIHVMQDGVQNPDVEGR
jgi:hypothetical protein